MAHEHLSNEAKAFIVQALACFDTPTQVAKAVKEELGLEVTRQKVEAYDPTKRIGANLSKKWRELFETTRKTFIEDTSGIGISHRAVRIRALQRMATKAEEMKNMKLAAELMEQAAKEMGDAYTNRRVLTGKNGEALVPQALPAVSGDAVIAAIQEVGGMFLGKRRD